MKRRGDEWRGKKSTPAAVGYFNRETLEPDYDVMDKYERREKREALETWVGDIGPDDCHKRIDEVWNRR